jgi:SAM-dependent methyltransferase
MSLADHVHGSYVYGRRIRVLARHLAELIPANATVLDVGCGDGSLGRAIAEQRPDLQMEGLEVLIRPLTHIRVSRYDGNALPFPTQHFDVVALVDVLHHTPDPAYLLGEAKRVARKAIVIKDHLLEGFLAGPTLRFMDRVGNRRHGVALPYNYWPKGTWMNVLASAGLVATTWRDQLDLYPWPVSLVFERSLHFIARLEPRA